jgi:hypothetical protein
LNGGLFREGGGEVKGGTAQDMEGQGRLGLPCIRGTRVSRRSAGVSHDGSLYCTPVEIPLEAEQTRGPRCWDCALGKARAWVVWCGVEWAASGDQRRGGRRLSIVYGRLGLAARPGGASRHSWLEHVRTLVLSDGLQFGWREDWPGVSRSGARCSKSMRWLGRWVCMRRAREGSASSAPFNRWPQASDVPNYVSARLACGWPFAVSGIRSRRRRRRRSVTSTEVSPVEGRSLVYR